MVIFMVLGLTPTKESYDNFSNFNCQELNMEDPGNKVLHYKEKVQNPNNMVICDINIHLTIHCYTMTLNKPQNQYAVGAVTL